MAVPEQPTNLFTQPFANNGAYNVIPDQPTTVGRASLNDGFPTETQLPLASGGVPPNRLDFNGILNMLSAFAYYQQSGGLFTFSATADYPVPAMIFHNDTLWLSVQQSGPSTTIGPVEPGTNNDVWRRFSVGGGGVPVGTVITFYGTAAPEGFLAMNGSTFSATTYPELYSVVGSTTLPDMRGFFVRGYSGGAATGVDPDGQSRAIGAVQGDAIRNIYGWANLGEFGDRTYGGAISVYANGLKSNKSSNNYGKLLDFDASRIVPVGSDNRPKNRCLLYCIKCDDI